MKAIIVKSVNRIFYRSAINQGLPLIVNREIVDQYKPGDPVKIDFEHSIIRIGNKEYSIPELPEKLMQIIEKKGLVHYLRNEK